MLSLGEGTGRSHANTAPLGGPGKVNAPEQLSVQVTSRRRDVTGRCNPASLLRPFSLQILSISKDKHLSYDTTMYLNCHHSHRI